MNHRTNYQDAISLLTRRSDGGAGARGYGAALGLVAGVSGYSIMRDRVSGFFDSAANGIESAIKWILFFLGAIVVVLVIK